MNDFETYLNSLFVDVFNKILRYEELSLNSALKVSVTVTETHMIDVIGKQNEKITVSEIASTLGLSVPTVTVALQKLEKKGFITKTSSTDDARRFLIGLTRSGQKIYKVHSLFHINMIEEITQNLSDIEKEALLSGVRKLNDFFGKKVKK